jgi:rhodanese-related sulfurtransferase
VSRIDDFLEQERSTYERISPERARQEVEEGARVVDIRPAWQRTVEAPGSLIIERNHLEWRLDPTSDARVPEAVAGQRWIVVCEEGYTSSLAAASLRRLGVDATDVIGGIVGWQEAGLTVVSGPSDVGRFVGDETGASTPTPVH